MFESVDGLFPAGLQKLRLFLVFVRHAFEADIVLGNDLIDKLLLPAALHGFSNQKNTDCQPGKQQGEKKSRPPGPVQKKNSAGNQEKNQNNSGYDQ